MTVSKGCKVVWVTNYLVPHRIRQYAILASDPHFEFTVLVTRKGFDRKQYFQVGAWPHWARHCPSMRIPTRFVDHGRPAELRAVEFPYGLFGILWRLRPAVVVSGDMGLGSMVAALYCILFRRKLLINACLTDHTERHNGWVRRLIRGALTRVASGFLTNKTEGRRYLTRALNVQAGRIYESPYSVDNNYFARHSNLSVVQRGVLAAQLNLRGLILIWVGSLEKHKGLRQFLNALATLDPAIRAQLSLLIIGDGPEREALDTFQQHQAVGQVCWLERVDNADLPSYYGVADLAVFSTLGDEWGAVVNEAMACGRPVACSVYAGCAIDLIDQRTGYLFDPLDLEGTARVFNQVFTEKSLLPKKGVAARKRIAQFTDARSARQIRRALKNVNDSSQKRVLGK